MASASNRKPIGFRMPGDRAKSTAAGPEEIAELLLNLPARICLDFSVAWRSGWRQAA